MSTILIVVADQFRIDCGEPDLVIDQQVLPNDQNQFQLTFQGNELLRSGQDNASCTITAFMEACEQIIKATTDTVVVRGTPVLINLVANLHSKELTNTRSSPWFEAMSRSPQYCIVGEAIHWTCQTSPPNATIHWVPSDQETSGFSCNDPPRCSNGYYVPTREGIQTMTIIASLNDSQGVLETVMQVDFAVGQAVNGNIELVFNRAPVVVLSGAAMYPSNNLTTTVAGSVSDVEGDPVTCVITPDPACPGNILSVSADGCEIQFQSNDVDDALCLFIANATDTRGAWSLSSITVFKGTYDVYRGPYISAKTQTPTQVSAGTQVLFTVTYGPLTATCVCGGPNVHGDLTVTRATSELNHCRFLMNAPPMDYELTCVLELVTPTNDVLRASTSFQVAVGAGRGHREQRAALCDAASMPQASILIDMSNTSSSPDTTEPPTTKETEMSAATPTTPTAAITSTTTTSTTPATATTPTTLATVPTATTVAPTKTSMVMPLSATNSSSAVATLPGTTTTSRALIALTTVEQATINATERCQSPCTSPSPASQIHAFLPGPTWVWQLSSVILASLVLAMIGYGVWHYRSARAKKKNNSAATSASEASTLPPPGLQLAPSHGATDAELPDATAPLASANVCPANVVVSQSPTHLTASAQAQSAPEPLSDPAHLRLPSPRPECVTVVVDVPDGTVFSQIPTIPSAVDVTAPPTCSHGRAFGDSLTSVASELTTPTCTRAHLEGPPP